MNQEESSVAAKLPRELLILTSEHVHQWILSDAEFWKSRNRLLRSMVRVNKHWHAALNSELYRVIELRDAGSMVALLHSLLLYPSLRGLMRALKMNWVYHRPISPFIWDDGSFSKNFLAPKTRRILELLPLLVNLYYLEIRHNWKSQHLMPFGENNYIFTLTGLEELSSFTPIELPKLRYLVLRGHHPFFYHLIRGFLPQLYALQCPWNWDTDKESPQVLFPLLTQAVLDCRRDRAKVIGSPHLRLGSNLHTLTLTCAIPHYLPLSALRELLVANASTLRLLRVLPEIDWPELKEETARLLPILKNLERLHVDITTPDGGPTALQFLLENIPKSYQVLEMTDNHRNTATCSKVVDILAAAPGIKPKELVIHGVDPLYVGQLGESISEKLDIPFRLIQTPDMDDLSFDVDVTWTPNK